MAIPPGSHVPLHIDVYQPCNHTSGSAVPRVAAPCTADSSMGRSRHPPSPHRPRPTVTTLPGMSAPVLARVVRGSFVESFHHGSLVVTSPTGEPTHAWGDPDAAVLPRSCLKPLQALALLEAGAQLSGRHLALACASHSGEPFHVDAVRETLADAGLTESDLANTPDWSLNPDARDAIVRAGGARASITQNCSGKHAAMLATCRLNGWPTQTYLDLNHPLQQAIVDTMSAFGTPPTATTIDGCGAPAHAITLTQLAHSFGRLCAASEPHQRAIADAMRSHPEYVGGSGRDNTDLMRLLPGAIAKDGAEGVYAVGLPDGRGIALKVADGSERARPVIIGAALQLLGVGTPDLHRRLAHAPVLGHGVPIGTIEATL